MVTPVVPAAKVGTLLQAEDLVQCLHRERLIGPVVHLFQAGLLQSPFSGCIQRAEAADQQLGQHPALGMLGTQLNTFLAAFFQTTLPALQDTLLDSLPTAFLPALFQPALRECAHLSVLRGVELFVEPPLFGGQCEVGFDEVQVFLPQVGIALQRQQSFHGLAVDTDPGRAVCRSGHADRGDAGHDVGAVGEVGCLHLGQPAGQEGEVLVATVPAFDDEPFFDCATAQEDSDRVDMAGLLGVDDRGRVAVHACDAEVPGDGLFLEEEDGIFAFAVAPVYAHRRVEDQGAVAQPAPGRLLPDEGDVDFVLQGDAFLGGEEGEGGLRVVEDQVLEVLVVTGAWGGTIPATVQPSGKAAGPAGIVIRGTTTVHLSSFSGCRCSHCGSTCAR